MKTYAETRLKARIHRKKKIYDLLGKTCAICGSDNRLEIDHIDPSNTSFRLSGDRLRLNWDLVSKELKKCQLLCFVCHRKKTATERRFNQVAHGTLAYYMNKKCRCDSCRQANSNYMRAYNARIKKETKKEIK